VAVTPRTRAGLLKFRPVESGARVALVAPASPFDPDAFEAGLAELKRIGLEPVIDARVFATHPIVAGPADVRAAVIADALARSDIQAVIAIRGGYGSAEVLPHLDAAAFRRSRKALVGYSDITAVHAFLNGHVRMTSVHGAMVDGRLSKGAAAYDVASFLNSLSRTPIGEQAPEGLEIIRGGEAVGPVVGGTLTQIAASLGTPHEFLPPPRHVLFLEDVAERPYRIRRLLTQLRQSGRLTDTSAVVFGQMLRCDEPGGGVTSRDVIAEFFADFPGPVLFGFPSGHTTTPSLSFPLGVETRVVATGSPRVVFTEAAAE
jgi:muramoyltetrapeptide carboxypeptidase